MRERIDLNGDITPTAERPLTARDCVTKFVGP